MARVLSIYLPTWEVDLLRRQDATAARSPLLLVVLQTRQQIVARCCPAAHEAGVTRGMSLAEARMLCDTVRVEPFDAPKSRAALERTARACARFSPFTAVDPTPLHPFPENTPDGLLLDITGEAHLFGSEHLLLTEVARWFHRLGLRARLAAAPTLGAAWALARLGPHALSLVQDDQLPQALGALPLEALRVDSEALENLRQVGVERLDQLLALPRESLRIRFGSDLLWRLDQMFGRIDERIVPLKPAEPLSVRRAFDGAVTQLEAIMLTVQDLLAELAQRLLLKESGVRSLHLELARADAPPIGCTVTLGRPSRNPKHLWQLLRAKVETMNLGFGVEALTLTAPWVQMLPHTQREAWQEETPSGVTELIDTLTNRQIPVTRMHPHESHTPEKSRIPIDEKTATKKDAVLVQGDRPALLLDPPEPAQAIALLPDAPPARIDWRGVEHRILSAIGPERITEWWQGAQTRDYFKVQTAAGQWLWVYRQLETSRWFVHGIW